MEVSAGLSLTALQLGVLLLAALCAGVVDAIAGGGGLISVPALLWAGLPTQLALGTNKGQGIWGTAAALWRYARAGMLDKARIRYSLPAAAHARLEVFDTAGRRVRVLHDGPAQAGPHMEPFPLDDGSGHPLASGLYLLRLETAGRSLTRRIAVVR